VAATTYAVDHRRVTAPHAARKRLVASHVPQQAETPVR
jgi:hypothetical protein